MARVSFGGLAALAGLVGLTCAAGGQPVYKVTVIGGAGTGAVPLALNSQGRVVGHLGPATGGYHAMSWRSGVFSALAADPGFLQTSALGVNGTGIVVGSGWAPDGAGLTARALAWNGGAAVDLGDLGGREAQALSVNSVGDIVGYSTLPGEEMVRAFLHRKGAMSALSVPAGTTESYAYDITNNGTIAGALVQGSPARPVVWRKGVLQELPIPPNARAGAANAVNELGVVVGTYESSLVTGSFKAVLWIGGVRAELGCLGGPLAYSTGADINNAGQIVGNSNSPAGMTGYLWQSGHMHDLRTQVVAGSPVITGARCVNERGQIAGTAQWGGQPVAVLLTPIAR